MEIEIRVAGIPAVAEITHVDAGEPTHLGVHAPGGDLIDPGHPGSAPSVEYQILDRRGRPAPWLERKIDDGEHEAVVEQILAELGVSQSPGVIGPTVRR